MLEFSQNLALSWPLVKNNYTVLLPGGCNLRSKTNSSPKILILNFCISARPEGSADHCAPSVFFFPISILFFLSHPLPFPFSTSSFIYLSIFYNLFFLLPISFHSLNLLFFFSLCFFPSLASSFHTLSLSVPTIFLSLSFPLSPSLSLSFNFPISSLFSTPLHPNFFLLSWAPVFSPQGPSTLGFGFGFGVPAKPPMTRFSEIHLCSFRQSFHLSLVTISPADTLVQRGMLRKVVRKNHRLEILDCVIKVERKGFF